MSRELDVAIGAVNCQKRFGLATAWLTFGMVSPAYQGKGLGSALVLARLSLLPKPTHAAPVLMTNVESSKAFYARFGFAPYGARPSGRPSLRLPCNSALIGEREWQACRERVASLGLTLPTIEAPRRIVRSLATARVTGLTQLVVLVELFGLIVLIIGWAHYLYYAVNICSDSSVVDCGSAGRRRCVDATVILSFLDFVRIHLSDACLALPASRLARPICDAHLVLRLKRPCRIRLSNTLFNPWIAI